MIQSEMVAADMRVIGLVNVLHFGSIRSELESQEHVQTRVLCLCKTERQSAGG